MRAVVTAPTPPADAIRLVGVVDGQPLEDVAVDLDRLARLGFEGRPHQTILLEGSDAPLLLVGLGEEVDVDTLRRAAGAAGRAVKVSEPLATSLHRLDLDGALEAVVVGVLAGSYRFDDYRSGDSAMPGDLVLVGEVDEARLARSRVLSRAVYQARDWVNRPPEDKAPAVLAEEMAGWLSEGGFEVEVWDEDRIGRERLGGLTGVSSGSDRPPRMVVGRLPAVDDRPHLALVGKGIVFDSGGLSIKTAEGMTTMKGDMAGAAAVVAAAGAIGRLPPAPAVTVYVPLTDNMSGGRAMKPGDVLRIRNGKTIEVLNTDAEGRLVLADALSLAAEAGPDLIVDVATLTGASRVALGDQIGAVFTGDDATRDRVLEAAARAGERMWPLPLPTDHRRLIDSTVADMKNTGSGRYGGAITAALLLAEFTGTVPWAHLDIAGPSFFREDDLMGPKGGSGFSVATLVELASALSEGR